MKKTISPFSTSLVRPEKLIKLGRLSRSDKWKMKDLLVSLN